MLEYQEKHLQVIKEILPLLGDKFVLKGGTALMLYYGLNRFSEDIDLDCKTNNMDFIKRLNRHKDFNKWNITIKKNTPTTFRITLDYGNKKDINPFLLKIEANSRQANLLASNKSIYNTIKGVNVYKIEELIEQKIAAFGARDKIRDYYDVGFLVDKFGKHLKSHNLKAIANKLAYMDFEDMDLLLKNEMLQAKLICKPEALDNFGEKLFAKTQEMLIAKSQVKSLS